MNKTHAIIFVPGFKGSVLVDEKKRLVWPNVLPAQYQNQSLHKHLPELGFANALICEPTDVITTVKAIPRVWERDFYGDFLQKLEANLSAESRLVSFAYDWRNDLVDIARRLNHFIIDLIAEGIRKIDIICHSMGGLITSYMLRYGSVSKEGKGEAWELTRYINQLVLVTVPFKGSAYAIHDLIHGSPFLWNKTLLSSEALSTFPSSYYLMPTYLGAITAREGKSFVEYSAYDKRFWSRYQLDKMKYRHTTPEFMEKRTSYIMQCLQNAKRFHSKLAEPAFGDVIPSHLKITNIYSGSEETLSDLLIEKDRSYTWRMHEGDGSVALSSFELPMGFNAFSRSEHLLNAEHTSIFCEDHVQKLIIDVLTAKNSAKPSTTEKQTA